MHKMKNIFSMKNKTVAIFGGTGKLGIQFEKILSDHGAKVYLLDKKPLPKNKNKKKLFLKCDVQNHKSVKIAFRKILQKEKKIHVVIYNVYSKPNNYYNRFQDYNLKTWKNVVDCNLTGAFIVSQLAINQFIKNKI